MKPEKQLHNTSAFKNQQLAGSMRDKMLLLIMVVCVMSPLHANLNTPGQSSISDSGFASYELNGLLYWPKMSDSPMQPCITNERWNDQPNMKLRQAQVSQPFTSSEETKTFLLQTPLFWIAWMFFIPAIMFITGIGNPLTLLMSQDKWIMKTLVSSEKEFLVDNHTAIRRERERIASEMHDDISAGLTTIHYLSDKAISKAGDSEEAMEFRRISYHSSILIRNMAEIIWSMNTRFDHAEDLIGYLRRYAAEYLAEHNKQFNFTIAEHPLLDRETFDAESRRNLFCVYKEALHNLVKHSGAASVSITVMRGNAFQIHIAESGGKGFDARVAKSHGNGLFNMERRMASIGGSIAFSQSGNGTDIDIVLPTSGAPRLNSSFTTNETTV